MNPVHFSSERQDWETPLEIFRPLEHEFCIELDVCATHVNAKARVHYPPGADGLTQSWSVWGSCWMNPPYGREIGKWVKKAHDESQLGATVVCLLPARTDTAWFHDYILGKAEIRWVRGRIKFVGAKHAAPFPSMIVIFNGNR